MKCGFHDSTGAVGTDFSTLVGGAITSVASVPVSAAFTTIAADLLEVACVADPRIQLSTRPSILAAIQVGAFVKQ